MLKILIVEDSALQRNVIVNHLLKRGHNVLTASTVNQGIKTFEKNMPIDLVISDVNLEEKDGIEMLKELHQKYPQNFTSLIVSTLNNKDQVIRAKLAGSKAWIVKPIPLDKLDLAINKLFYGK